MRLIAVLIATILIVSCKTIPLYKKTFTVNVEKNKVCRVDLSRDKDGIIKEDRSKCYELNHKDGAEYKFNNYDGYILISVKALRETLLKAVDGLK